MKRIEASARLRRLAPDYLLLAILYFGAFFWFNRYDISKANFVMWLVLAVVLIVMPLILDALWLMRHQALDDPVALGKLRTAHFLIGLACLLPSVLIATGLDVSHWMGTLYATHGLSEEVYFSHGVIPSSGSVAVATVVLPVFLAFWSLLLAIGKPTTNSYVVKAFIAISLTVAWSFILFLMDFAHNYQF